MDEITNFLHQLYRTDPIAHRAMRALTEKYRRRGELGYVEDLIAIKREEILFDLVLAYRQVIDNQREERERNEVRGNIAEIIARNLTAWDTSGDKTHGLLPEVYLTDLGLYRQLTGEEYTFMGACKRFNIGDD